MTGKNPPLVEDILSDSNALMIDGLSSSMQNVIVQSMMAAGSKRPQNVAQLKAMLSSAEATQFVPDNYYPGGSEGSSQKPSVPSQGNNKYLLGIMVLLGIIAILGIVFLAKSLIGDDANQQSESKQEVEVVTSDSDTTNVGTETYKYKETKKEKVEEEPKQAPKEESKKETKQEKEEKEKIEAPVSKAITISYKGTVGPYNVTMTLKYPDGNVVGGRVSGSYTYTKFKNKLYLNGYLTDTGILLTETTPKGNNSGDWSLMGSDLDYLYGNMSAYHDGSCNEVNLRRVK